jgi:anti-sigma factor RsiW
MQCRDFRELADSYLSDELLVETNHDVIRHLETCPDCRRELAARRELRSKLRAGFENAPDLQTSEEFSDRLTSQLRDAAFSRARFSAAKSLPLPRHC